MSPALFDPDVLAFDEAGLPQSFPKRVGIEAIRVGRGGVQEANEGYVPRLVNGRPDEREPAECADDLPPPHSITSSALVWSVAGTWIPRTLAVFRLTSSSSLSDCWTIGISAGLSPFRILPAYTPMW